MEQIMEQAMNDRVLIEGLTLTTTIGVYEWEKEIKQKIVLDLTIAWDNQSAGISDDVTYCLDYAKVSKLVTHYIQNQAFGLIERVAEETAALIMQNYPVTWIRVKVSKPHAVVNASNVAVIIERTAIERTAIERTAANSMRDQDSHTGY